MQTLFACLITLQFMAVVFHDMLDIPGWTHGRQVRATLGPRKFWLATGINAIFPGLAVGFALCNWGKPGGPWAINYWVAYCAITLLSAIGMWYVPYFFGTSEKTSQEYAQMYAGTWQVLPARGANPRPNVLHICFHVLFVVTFVLALALRFQCA